MERTAYTTCPLCEATCGLELTMLDGRITGVRGDRDDVLSRGFVCPKGAALGGLDADPDRVRTPRVRRDGKLVPATWDEAFAAVDEGLGRVIAAHGRDAVALYLGNPTVHTLAGNLFAAPLRKAIGSRNIFTASTVDQMPKHVSCGHLFGNPLAVPVPDVDRTDFLLVLGADPMSSNGSLWTVPDLPGRLAALRARGGRLVVVDPRRSRTARVADRHLPIRPGTDAFLLLGMVHELFARDLVTPGALEPHLTGVAAVRDLVARFSPDVVAPACGVDPTAIRDLAADLAAAPRAAVYGRIGTTTVPHGTVTSWLVDVLNVLTGNLDRPGGAMFALPAHSRRGTGTGAGFRTGRWHSRVRGLPEVLGELPAVTLADEILTPGEGQVRALLTVAGNPVLSLPNSARLDGAIAGLDFMVCVDPYVNATTRHAHVLLPPPPPSQQAHYDMAFYHFAVRNVARFSPPVVPLPPDALDECDILLRLIAILTGAGPDVATDGAAQARGILDARLRAGPYGLSLDRLLAEPHGVDLGPLEPRVPEILRTPSGRIELCPEPIAAEVSRLDPRPPEPDTFVVVGRRHLRTNNSWMHNVPALVKGRPLCTVVVNRGDADRLGLVAGGRARVTSRVGEVELTVEVTDDIAPGVVSIPHGFGHDLPGVEMSVARHLPGGVNTNLLTDDLAIDPLSGNAVLNGIPVSLRGRDGGDRTAQVS
ncbi:molybdopterin-dependent oxidoreductase [Virgisporangium aurantiacum]|uniref:Molybdopterin-binding oxidoreductase n=1 Tax=Virgisporangium aurantiacum TaxID=175570 RepID=A0A8J4E7D6_9ACTN|nr:molybdopterin-dependent oxidoreductase [Virgisporangium aurantiacum]GIJ64093.1 molybdopterin-binding oxidoreductase [Virgisporangium aurantiacum]